MSGWMGRNNEKIPFMIILGINAYHADSSAAIFIDGRMVAAIEEERFTRVKHWAGFPVRAIEFCLREAGIEISQVDRFAVGRDPGAKFLRKLLYVASHPSGSLNAIRDRLANSGKMVSIGKELAAMSGLSASIFKNKVFHAEHHRSHLASAFFASPFNEAACLSIDGSGDFSTTMTAIGRGNDLHVLDSVDFPHSLGIFYSAFTQFLGFPHYGDEYKVMGMAPYGKPLYIDKVRKLINLTNDGLFSLDTSFFRKGTAGIISYGDDHLPHVATLYSKRMTDQFGKPREQGGELTQYHRDLAASVQQMTEEVIFHVLNHLHDKTRLDAVCIAGGVAQNSVANGKITRKTPFKKLYVPSAGHDAGISMGAALYLQHAVLGKERTAPVFSAYTGSKYSNEEIIRVLDKKGVRYERMNDEDMLDAVTECLIHGGVVGWMQGRSEFGPRALGGRSIIADPRRQDAKELLNTKIKRRESFRPFAPSILKEYVAEYFEVDEPAPFMERVLPIRKDKQELIPAVTHVDGSGRLQTVDREIAPRYHALIDLFRKKTGIPILLNTSFNENEPIVNSPGEALDCFLRTEMDMLVMENIVIRRNP